MPIRTAPQKGAMGAELPAGTYQFKLLEVEEAEQDEVKFSEVNGKKVGTKTGGRETVYKFKFSCFHPELGEAFAVSRVRPFVSPNSGLVKLVRQLAPGYATPDVLNDMNKLLKLLNFLEGKQFFITTEPNQGYNNIVSVVPAPTQAAQAAGPAKVAPRMKTEPTPKIELPEDGPPPHTDDDVPVFDDDDIPF